ncbi:hypothetical protein J1605_003155 [Eschrichtius robustus]|uniref:Cystatin-16 n=1 Tax=Eschrichtius robustus TaxID=9764 RepID=A0AB34HQ92_ESCRO|nr:hypothetical protein J1605_003155 [Eschrichtius robustus]
MQRRSWAQASSKREARAQGCVGCGLRRATPPPAPHHLPFVLTLDSMFPKAALLLGLTVVGIHVRTIQKEFVDISKDHDYFAVSVEFAVAWFNSGHEEGHAYKLLEVSPGPVEAEGPSSITADSAATPALP